MVSDELDDSEIFDDEWVLILVVMEYGLRPLPAGLYDVMDGLNPCCNGIWSQTLSKTCKELNKRLS